MRVATDAIRTGAVRLVEHRIWCPVVMPDEEFCGIGRQTDILGALKDTFLGTEWAL
jgi:hypothetical protein